MIFLITTDYSVIPDDTHKWMKELVDGKYTLDTGFMDKYPKFPFSLRFFSPNRAHIVPVKNESELLNVLVATSLYRVPHGRYMNDGHPGWTIKADE